MKTLSSYTFLFANNYRMMASGRQGAPNFQEIRPGTGFKTGDSFEETLGRATTVKRIFAGHDPARGSGQGVYKTLAV